MNFEYAAKTNKYENNKMQKKFKNAREIKMHE
jgi:hypothetical protein